MRIEFFGATGEVTGSCHVVECQGQRILVDCGMIQGGGDVRRRNRAAFPFHAGDIRAVVLTHAHIDHSGRLPVLLKRGFKGEVYAQGASCDLVEILLQDSARLQEYDAERMSRKRRDAGKAQVKPLYDTSEAEATIKRLRGCPYRQWFDVIPGVRCRFWDAGHILGSTCAELELEENGQRRRVVFSGDLGQYNTPILRDPEVLQPTVDAVVMESTYGDRHHRDRDATLEEFAAILDTTANQGGSILIPAFAVGRSQEIIYHLANYFDDWGVGRFRIFLDSPLAIEASKIYWSHPQLYDAEATKLRRENGGAPILPNLQLSHTPDDSRAINEIDTNVIIIAGSGMCTGGRILHHLRHRLGRTNTQVLFTGFQAYGTLGRRLVDGVHSVRLYGEDITVNAQVHTLGGFSAHGDQADLTRWISQFQPAPPVYLVHGEPDSAQALQTHLAHSTGIQATLPQAGEAVDLLARDGVG